MKTTGNNFARLDANERKWFFLTNERVRIFTFNRIA